MEQTTNEYYCPYERSIALSKENRLVKNKTFFDRVKSNVKTVLTK